MKYIFQMPYIQSVAIFLIVVLELTGNLTIGDLNPRGPYLYLMIMILLSFFWGLWALFVFFDITHRFDLLHDYQYRAKSAMIKTIVILVNIQVRMILWSIDRLSLRNDLLTLHLIPFASKLIYCSSHTKSLKMREISRFASIFLDFKNAKTALLNEPSKIQCDSNNWPIEMQKVPNEALFNWLQILFIFCSKIHCLTQTTGRQIFVYHIHME